MKLRYLLILVLAGAVLLTAMGCDRLPEAEGTQPTEDRSVMATVGTTEAATEAPTDPQPEVFTLSFAGDCTLGCDKDLLNPDLSFPAVVGEDYDYPLANVRHIFEADDFTLVNLEGTLTHRGTPMDKEFTFRGDPAYTAILTGGSVEAVSNANNHFYDYGEVGMRDTTAALDAAGIAHAWRDSFLYTTASGLTIGVYCDDFSFDRAEMADAITGLRAQGAEIVICAFHWGVEKAYTPTADQTIWAHTAIDLGADIVAGHHPHVLQPVEFYGSGVIYYSLGNFCYGGSVTPYDMDTAIIRQQVVRQPDGTVSLGDTTAIPCSVSSISGRNNYQPTPMEEGSEAWQRVMDKLGL